MKNEPIHVLVESTLGLAIIYVLLSRNRKKNYQAKRDRLSPSEEAEILAEWKESRDPLAPLDSQARPSPIVHAMNGRTMSIQTDPKKVSLRTVLNFATFDFLGRSTGEDSAKNPVKRAAQGALDKYGCGSCGPRGFYGTIDVHLDLEKAFAKFLGTDASVLYSDGASTCSSSVAAFCTRPDLLVVDEAIYEPLITGVTLSRANVKVFAHNDMKDLRRVLEQVRAADKKKGIRSDAQRKFLVVEGLYRNTGSVVPLDEVVKLKEEFGYRIILDESHSFGVLGNTGRGVTELFGLKPMKDIEITTISLENAIGSIGGITAGSDEVVDHQRLSGSGYVFSASSPPFTATAAIKSLELLENQPESVSKLSRNVQYLQKKLHSLCQNEMEEVLTVSCDTKSPLILLRIAPMPDLENLDQGAFLAEVVRECLERGVAFVATGGTKMASMKGEHPPAIRVTASVSHTTEDMDKAVAVLGEAVDEVLNNFQDVSV